jgi:hypothetical protein
MKFEQGCCKRCGQPSISPKTLGKVLKKAKEHGLEPAFAQHCIGRALQFVTPEELTVVTAQRHTLSVGTVSYASSKWKLTELS